MTRDLAMIFSVLTAVASLGFGAYKTIEARNAKGFAYDQAYRIMDAIQQAPIAPATKADLFDASLDLLATPPPVIDLSRSSADTADVAVCDAQQVAMCGELASQLALANATCQRSKQVADACDVAGMIKKKITDLHCAQCYRP